MANVLRVVLETGPKGKRTVAVAPDWPGLSRGAKTAEAALDLLLAYRPRYEPVAKLAGMDSKFTSSNAIDVVERYQGTGSTDFWGISFAFSSIDRQSMSKDELERELALMRASWMFFDTLRSRVSAELRRGPRGGGRDRDQVVRHTIGAEQDWAKGIGVPGFEGGLPSERELDEYRDAYCAAIRTHHMEGKMAKKWPLRFLIRHTAFHTLDHAWEMEDKDLSDNGA